MGFHQGISKGAKFVPRAGGVGAFWLLVILTAAKIIQGLQPGKEGKASDHQLWPATVEGRKEGRSKLPVVVTEVRGLGRVGGKNSLIVVLIISRSPRKVVGVLTPVVQLEFKERCAEPSPALIH